MEAGGEADERRVVLEAALRDVEGFFCGLVVVVAVGIETGGPPSMKLREKSLVLGVRPIPPV